MAGPGIRPIRLTNAHLTDIAPTILALLQPAGVDAIHSTDAPRAGNVLYGADCVHAPDGRVLSEALENPGPFESPVERTASMITEATANDDDKYPIRSYTPAEAQVVKERLRSLGYLE